MSLVIEIRELENCFDGSFMKEVEIDEPLNLNIMNRMAQDARLKYYPHFPRPYFRIERDGAFILQGVIGNKTFRATLSPRNVEEAEIILRNLIEDK